MNQITAVPEKAAPFPGFKESLILGTIGCIMGPSGKKTAPCFA